MLLIDCPSLNFEKFPRCILKCFRYVIVLDFFDILITCPSLNFEKFPHRFLWLYPPMPLPSPSSQITLSTNNQKSFPSTFAIVHIEFQFPVRLLFNCLFTSPALLLVDFNEEVCQIWIRSCGEKKFTLFSSAFSDPPPGHVFTHTGCIGWGALGNLDPLWWQPLFACPTNITYITSHTNALPYISLHFTRHCLPVHLHRGH